MSSEVRFPERPKRRILVQWLIKTMLLGERGHGVGEAGLGGWLGGWGVAVVAKKPRNCVISGRLLRVW